MAFIGRVVESSIEIYFVVEVSELSVYALEEVIVASNELDEVYSDGKEDDSDDDPSSVFHLLI